MNSDRTFEHHQQTDACLCKPEMGSELLRAATRPTGPVPQAMQIIVRRVL